MKPAVDGERAIRLVVLQPALPAYRVPFFAEVARRPGIRLTVRYGTLPGLPNAGPDGFDAVPNPRRRFRLLNRTLWWEPAQWRCAGSRDTDVLLLSWDLNVLSLVPALLRARRRGVSTILWGHGYSKREAAWRRVPRERVTGLATALLFYNHTTADQFIERGCDSRRVFVALNSLDQTPIEHARRAWQESPDRLEAFRHEHDLADRSTVLFVSRLTADNRLDLLIRAAALLERDVPRLSVVVVGDGPDREPAERLAASLGVDGCVRFVGAVYDEDALAPWFLSADVFCYPCNVGLSLLHAFGYGLPAVTSDRMEAQNPEIEAFRDGENGLLYAHDDPASLAATLRRLFDDRSLRQRLAEQALDTVRERFNLIRMADGMVNAARYCHSKRDDGPKGE